MNIHMPNHPIYRHGTINPITKCRGLANNKTTFHIFNTVKEHNNDIILLQDIHWISIP